ncbi:MAG TPA: FAD-dependent oxidoreductase, partial [Herpetosiphonaceae bacterium]
QREPFVSYSACGLPYFIAGQVPEHAALVARTPEQFARTGITIKTEHEVLEIDHPRQQLKALDQRSGATVTDSYDHLVFATGAKVFCPPVSGIDLNGVFQLRSLVDGLAIKRYIADHRPKNAVIIGAGYIGVEMAETFLQLGMNVTILDMAPRPLSTLDPEMAAMVAKALEDAGVTLALDTKLEGLEGDGSGRVSCVGSGGATMAGDLVLLATGVAPNSELAKAIGVGLGPRGAICADQLGKTNLERVYAAGDCATVHHRVLDMNVYMPLGTTANKQGRALGMTLAGVEHPFKGVVGSSVTKFNDLHVAATGLTEEAAGKAGFAVKAARIESTDHAGYYPGARPIHVKLVAEAGSGRLLGGQIIGYEEVAKRADILAVAVQQRLTVDEFAWSDLTYAPPFSSVWDPVLVAAQVLAGER